jgi:two-component system sensor histidine kinase KdpD
MRLGGAWAARQALGPALGALATIILRPLQPNPADVALSYLMVVLVASAAAGLWAGAVVSLAATLAFNYFFLPPTYTLTIADPANWFALGAFMVTAIVTSQLVARVAARSRQAEEQARQTRRLLELSRGILGRVTGAEDTMDMLAALADDCGRALGADRALAQEWVGGGPGPWCPAAAAALWPAEWLDFAASQVWADFPRRPQAVRVPGATTVLALPLGRRTGHRVVLLAAGGAMEVGIAEAVGGLGSLALERFHLLREITDARALRRSDELKSALLSSVSHELRTPLAAIRVSATALQRPEVWVDEASRQDLLHTLDDEASRLNRLIANLLCMSRIEAGALALERRPCAAETLVWEGVQQARPRLSPQRVSMAIPDGLPLLDCDPGLAAIALGNLLDNAAKYAPPGTPVEVGGRPSGDGRLVAIWVDDRGPGVPPGEAERIFERFYRSGLGSGPRLEGPSGTGLGLSIARALVEAHGGRLWVEARPGGGSRFTATWPAAAEVRRMPGAPARAPWGG